MNEGRAALPPRDRLAALAGQGGFDEIDAVAPSVHLQRYGIVAQADDGVVCARLTVGGRSALVAAQDARFLGGSVGASHGAKLAALFRRARDEQLPVLLLAASGGVRLHEANPAELALARALQELLATRAAGLPVLAVATGDVFGGMSVLACACDRLALLPGIRFGLSGPGVIETAHGRHDLDAADPAIVETLFGARARAAAGAAELLGDDVGHIGAWFERAAREPVDFAARVAAMHLRLGRRLPGTAIATEAAFAPGLEVREGRLWLPAVGGTLSAVAAHALTSALLSAPPAAREVLIAEDSQGHEVSRAAEKVVLSQYLAHHAAAIALLRARGVRIVGVLDGVGHSAAFFANALQADVVYARPQARVVAIEPAALARITRLDPAVIAARVEDDPLLGQPVRHFAALGGATLVTAEALIG